MPGLPLVVHESSNLGGNCSHSRSVDQMCRQDSRVHLSAEEAIAAEESLSIYCKPVELYNILQRRALRNPLFLQRCLDYKIQAKRKRRIKITISLSAAMNNGEQVQKLFPLYVLLVRPIPGVTIEEHSSIYRLSRACILSAFYEDGRRDHTEAIFILPELKKLLADGKSGGLSIVLLSYGELRNSSEEKDFLKDQDIGSFRSKLEGSCLWGRLQMEFLYSSWDKSASFNLGNRAETLLTVDMHTSFLKPGCMNEDNCIMFQGSHTSVSIQLKQVQVNVFAQEIGVVERSPYDSYTFEDVPSSSLAHIMRLRAGNVIFNYRYYNNTLQKTEVTVEFSCPFCLVQCGSFKGLRFHLTCSHDLFSFEFWVTEEYQAVNVSVKTDIWRAEIVADGVDPRLQTFSYGSKPRKRRRLKNAVQDVKHVCPHIMKLDSPVEAREGSQEGSIEREAVASSPQLPMLTYPKDTEPFNGFSLRRCETDGKGEKTPKAILSEAHLHSERHKSETQAQLCPEPVISNSVPGACAATAVGFTGTDCAHQASGSNITTPTVLQFAKTRKISAERGDPRNRALLQKRQFLHSHRAQPMALDQVLSDRDSEDEVDDDIADFEDRRMLDDFVDVTKDEKQIMHLWNSFVRKQRVLADGHIPWACEAFSKLHGPDLVREPALIWCWRLFMIKLWNQSLLDAPSMNNCNLILESFQNKTADPKLS
ncbi:polycomb group protein EMF2B-like isoform X1 [Aristolochia californica]|uniref:polycomb group protein EMF2B-like isoform X1 n=1 Tax=Aristolochia californica TaxID=171875 RepID=UPI0035E2FA7D